ncbi:formylglycine-generating enzyme family protein [Candidatus Poribacteria bacterium]|nr:formylglycine-generating enzyme family protein [Candidatus Poribacteria bacterium]
MSKRDEYILFINRLKAVSPTITNEQRKGLLRQATQEYEIAADDAVKILIESGLMVGETENYFAVFGLTYDELQEWQENAIIAQVEAKHKELYATSLKAGGLPRPDGRTQEQWRTVLNQARDVLIDPQKRHEHATMLQYGEIDILSEFKKSSDYDLSEMDEIAITELSHENLPNAIDVPNEMVYIHAGQFQMGSNDMDANDDEEPVHTVSLDTFLMDKYPVTNSDFKEFLIADAERYKPEWLRDNIDITYQDGGYLRHWDGDMYPHGTHDHPVTGVSWFAAMAYAQWAGKRLPTEAEWEKAARGRLSGKKYPWGDSINPDNENYIYNRSDTIPVGSYSANGFGLYDMCGNVWEWCLDAYDTDFYNIPISQNPFSGTNSLTWVLGNFRRVKTARVLRGGPWGADSQVARVSQRFTGSPTDTLPTFGFRCVMDVKT